MDYERRKIQIKNNLKFTDSKLLYDMMIKDSRLLEYNDDLLDRVSKEYKNNIITNIRNLRENSPAYIRRNFYDQIGRPDNITFQRYELYIFTLTFINYVDEHREEIKNIPSITTVFDWCDKRRVYNVKYLINGPISNTDYNIDFDKHYAEIIGQISTEKYTELSSLKSTENSLLKLLEFMMSNPNVYNKVENKINKFILNMSTNENFIIDSSYKFISTNSELGNVLDNESSHVNYNTVEVKYGEQESLSRIYIAKLNRLFNMYNVVRLSNFTCANSIFINDVSLLPTVYIIFPKLLINGRNITNSSDSTYYNSLMFKGRFTKEDNNTYKFESYNDSVTYNPTNIRVEEFSFIISTDINLSHNNILFSPITTSVKTDDIFNVLINKNIPFDIRTEYNFTESKTVYKLDKEIERYKYETPSRSDYDKLINQFKMIELITPSEEVIDTYKNYLKNWINKLRIENKLRLNVYDPFIRSIDKMNRQEILNNLYELIAIDNDIYHRVLTTRTDLTPKIIKELMKYNENIYGLSYNVKYDNSLLLKIMNTCNFKSVEEFKNIYGEMSKLFKEVELSSYTSSIENIKKTYTIDLNTGKIDGKYFRINDGAITFIDPHTNEQYSTPDSNYIFYNDADLILITVMNNYFFFSNHLSTFQYLGNGRPTDKFKFDNIYNVFIDGDIKQISSNSSQSFNWNNLNKMKYRYYIDYTKNISTEYITSEATGEIFIKNNQNKFVNRYGIEFEHDISNMKLTADYVLGDKRLFYCDMSGDYYSFDMYEYYYDELYYIYKQFTNFDLKIYVKNKIDNIDSMTIEMNMVSFKVKDSNITSFKYPLNLFFGNLQINLNMIEKSYLQIYDEMISIIILTFSGQKYYSISITGNSLVIDNDDYVLSNPKIELQEMTKNETKCDIKNGTTRYDSESSTTGYNLKNGTTRYDNEIIFKNDTEIIYHDLHNLKSYVLVSSVNDYTQYVLPSIGVDYVLNDDKSNYKKAFHIDNMIVNRSFDYDNYRDSLTFTFNNNMNIVKISQDLCFDDFTFYKTDNETRTGKVYVKDGKAYDENMNEIKSKEINLYKYETINTDVRIEEEFDIVDDYLEIEYKDYKFIIENKDIVVYEKMNGTYIKIYNNSMMLSLHEYIFEYLNSTYKLIINYNGNYLNNIFIVKRVNERVRLFSGYIQVFKTMKLDNICTPNSNIRSNLIDYNEKYLEFDKDYKTDFKQYKSITGVYKSSGKDISPHNTNPEKILYNTSNNFNNVNQNQYTSYEENGETYLSSIKNNGVVSYNSSETINLVNTDREINLTLEFV